MTQHLVDIIAEGGRIVNLGSGTARIAFLCSPEASFISGAIIPIDGGYHL